MIHQQRASIAPDCHSREIYLYQLLIVLILMKSYQDKIQNLQEENSYLKVENLNVNRINRELQCRADPFSTDGDAICNYDEDD